MAIIFGAPKKGNTQRRTKKEELFPNNAIVTMLAINQDPNVTRKTRKFSFNTKAVETLNLLAEKDGSIINDYVIMGNTQENCKGDYLIAVYGPAFTMSEKLRVTKSFTVSNGPWYDSIVENLNLDNTVDNYLELTPYTDNHSFDGATLYTLTPYTPTNTETDTTESTDVDNTDDVESEAFAQDTPQSVEEVSMNGADVSPELVQH